MSNVIALWEGGDSAVRKWWLNPFKFVDADDILTKKRGAKVFFYDLLVNRPTEFRTLIVLFMAAYTNLDEEMVQLTYRQQQAVSLARQAMIMGEPPVMFVSHRLNITKQASSALLKRAGIKLEMLTFEDLFAVYVSSEQQQDWHPTEKQIQAQKAKLRRTCAASGTPGCKGTTRGQFALCQTCAAHYGKTREEWTNPHTKEPLTWLLSEARRIDIETRNAAINELHKHHIGFEEETLSKAAA